MVSMRLQRSYLTFPSPPCVRTSIWIPTSRIYGCVCRGILGTNIDHYHPKRCRNEVVANFADRGSPYLSPRKSPLETKTANTSPLTSSSHHSFKRTTVLCMKASVKASVPFYTDRSVTPTKKGKGERRKRNETKRNERSETGFQVLRIIIIIK